MDLLLFSLYVNDLHIYLRDPNVFRILYADGLQIYVQIPFDRVMEEIASLPAAAQRVSAWAKENCLRLNVFGYSATVFGYFS